MASLVRYVYARCIISQHWLPPILLFFLLVGFLFPPGRHTFGGSSAAGAMLLLPFSAWFAISAINSEDQSQRSITAVTAGGFGKARAATMLAAASCAGLLAIFSIAAALVRDPDVWDAKAFSERGIAELVVFAVLAHAAAAVFGAAIGGFVAKPSVNRAGYSWLAVALVAIVAVAVPGSPFQWLVEVLNRRPDAASGPELGLAIAIICAVSTLVLAGGLALARRRN
jgi:hypothetical protein